MLFKFKLFSSFLITFGIVSSSIIGAYFILQKIENSENKKLNEKKKLNGNKDNFSGQEIFLELKKLKKRIWELISFNPYSRSHREEYILKMTLIKKKLEDIKNSESMWGNYDLFIKNQLNICYVWIEFIEGKFHTTKKRRKENRFIFLKSAKNLRNS